MNVIIYYVIGRRQWQPTPGLLPGKSHGRRSLVGCSPWGREESDTTEGLHFSLSCIGEGNGNPIQCSCLENPRDGGAWWATIYGVAQSQTWLKRLSCSSSISMMPMYRVISCVVGRECLLWSVCSLDKTRLVFALLYFELQDQIACFSRYLLTSYFCIPNPVMKGTSFFGVSCRRSSRSSWNRSTSAYLASVVGA